MTSQDRGSTPLGSTINETFGTADVLLACVIPKRYGQEKLFPCFRIILQDGFGRYVNSTFPSKGRNSKSEVNNGGLG